MPVVEIAAQLRHIVDAEAIEADEQALVEVARAADGSMRGRSLGGRKADELNAIASALLDDTPLPVIAGIGSTSPVPEAAAFDATGPRSHA